MFKLPNGFNVGPYAVLLFIAFLFYWFFPSNLAQRSPSLPQREPVEVSRAVETAVQPEVTLEITRRDEALPQSVPIESTLVPEVLSSMPVVPSPQEMEQRSAIHPGEHPRIAVVIDDLGLNAAATRAAIALPPEVALSFLPYGKGVAAQAQAAKERGHEILLHLPMQPVGREHPGPEALTTDLSDDELVMRVQRAFIAVPGAVGVNNHMGSKFTADENRLLPVMQEIKKHEVFFLDSKTTSQSQALAMAHTQGIPVLGRDIFLDDVVTEADVRRELARLEAVAVERNSAIAIGHPHPVTLEVLRSWLAQLESRGFKLVPLTSLLPERGVVPNR